MGMEKCTDPMVGGARSITLYDACTPSSVVGLNRLLKLNSWSTGGGAVYLAIVMVYGI